jgi:hypothetical protein
MLDKEWQYNFGREKSLVKIFLSCLQRCFRNSFHSSFSMSINNLKEDMVRPIVFLSAYLYSTVKHQ